MPGPIRGEVPMPEGRPYSLGNTSADYASINATSEMSASSRSPRPAPLENPRAVSYETTTSYAPQPEFGLCCRSIRAARAKCSAGAGSTELHLLPFEKSDQGGIDLVGALLLDPVAGALDDQLLPSGSAARAPCSLTRLAPIRPVMTASFDPAMNSDG